MIDATTVSVIGLLSGALGFALKAVFFAGEKHSGVTAKVENHDIRLHEHSQRLGDHDLLFQNMHKDYVPRPELEKSLENIDRSQQKTEQLLLHLVTKRPIDSGIDS